MRQEFESYCHEGAYPEIVINNADELTKSQFAQVLRRIRKTVELEPIKLYDCNERGVKDTTCNWGLCSGTAEHYPDPDLHQFPMLFVDEGRVSELDPPSGLACPMRTKNRGMGSIGCFYDCAAFSEKGPKPTREQALSRIDAILIEVEE